MNQTGNDSRSEMFWRLFYRKPKSSKWQIWDFTKYETAKAMKARFEKLGYETRPLMPVFSKQTSWR